MSILDRSYSPASISVSAGTTVRWVNSSGRDHTVTATDRSYDSGNLGSGAGYSRTYDAPGTYNYFCIIHPDMRGIVQVGAAGEAPPPPPPPPPAAPEEPESGGQSGAPSVSGNVRMLDYSFSPARVNARVGDRLVWANAGLAPHTATANDGSFNTGIVASGSRATTTLRKAGTFSFYCTIHPGMTGTLVVAEAPPGVEVPPEEEEVAADAEEPGAAESSTSDGPSLAIDVVDFAFESSAVVVEVGTRIDWRFVGAAPHTVTDTAGSFDSGILESGATWSYTPTEVGTVEYVCALHPNMVGTLEVVEATADAAPVDDGAQEVESAAVLLATDGGGDSWKGALALAGAILALLLLFGLLRGIEREHGSVASHPMAD